MQRVIDKSISVNAEKAVIKLSILVSCAAVLQVAESIIPHPLPGVRLGLANMITLIAMVDIDFRSAFKIAMLRTLIGSIILGTFLTPSFVLSFAGSATSTLMMALFYQLSLRRTGIRFSLLGISIIGALSHNFAQIILVYMLFIRSKGILLLWPWLAVSGVIMGIITGLIAVYVCKKLASQPRERASEKMNVNFSTPQGHYVSKKSIIHHMRPEVKIVFVVMLAVVIILVKNLVFYASLFGLLVALTVIARVKFSGLVYNLKRIISFILLSCFIPIIFTSSGLVLYSIGPLKITQSGLMLGVSFALRIILLFFATTLLALTTSPHTIAKGLEMLLSPLQLIGISVNKLAQSLCISWSFFPILWQRAKNFLKLRPGKKHYLKNITYFLGDLVTEIYTLSDQVVLLLPESNSGNKIDTPEAMRNELSVKTGTVAP